MPSASLQSVPEAQPHQPDPGSASWLRSPGWGRQYQAKALSRERDQWGQCPLGTCMMTWPCLSSASLGPPTGASWPRARPRRTRCPGQGRAEPGLRA